MCKRKSDISWRCRHACGFWIVMRKFGAKWSWNCATKETASTKTAAIVFKHNVSRDFGDDLLKILHNEGLSVPLFTKTLLRSPPSKAIFWTVACGEYVHLGLVKQLYYLQDGLETLDSITIDIGIDGIRLFKRSTKSLWPILGRTVGLPKSIYLWSGHITVKASRHVSTHICMTWLRN